MLGRDAKLSEILADKGPNVFNVGPEETVMKAVALMNQKKIGSLLVLHATELVGMFTERDVLTRIVGAGRDPVATRVSEVMTKDLVVVAPTTTVEEALRIITTKRIRHLPVMEGGKLQGMVSIGDLSRWLVREHESYIDNLLQYIRGDYTI